MIWKSVLCVVMIITMLCSFALASASTTELTTNCVDQAAPFLSDPWGAVGNVISNGFNVVKSADLYRRYGDFSITLQLGDAQETVGPNTIVSCIAVADNGNEYYEDSKISAYVAELAGKYNTADKQNSFMTSYGYEIPVPGGVYGWLLNQGGTAEVLKEALYAHQSKTVNAVWSQTAGSYGSGDIGSTYVEVSIQNQHLFLYKDGQKILETDVVTGNTSLGRGTPTGFYKINSKSTNTVLRGEDYASPVSFWMPFNRGVGLHDATWRSSFGGTIYQNDGSHGCVNMPYDAAKIAYENVSVGTPVIVY